MQPLVLHYFDTNYTQQLNLQPVIDAALYTIHMQK